MTARCRKRTYLINLNVKKMHLWVKTFSFPLSLYIKYIDFMSTRQITEVKPVSTHGTGLRLFFTHTYIFCHCQRTAQPYPAWVISNLRVHMVQRHILQF